MKTLRTLATAVLAATLMACSELPDAETPPTGTLNGTITALNPDRSSLRLSGTSLFITRQNDVLTLPSVPPTKFFVKGKVAPLEGLKVGQKVRIKAKEGYALEVYLLPAEPKTEPKAEPKAEKPDK